MYTATAENSNANLHGLPEDATNEGLPPVQAALGLKHVHELAIADAAVGGSGFGSFLCPASSRHAAIPAEDQPLQHRSGCHAPVVFSFMAGRGGKRDPGGGVRGMLIHRQGVMHQLCSVLWPRGKGGGGRGEQERGGDGGCSYTGRVSCTTWVRLHAAGNTYVLGFGFMSWGPSAGRHTMETHIKRLFHMSVMSPDVYFPHLMTWDRLAVPPAVHCADCGRQSKDRGWH